MFSSNHFISFPLFSQSCLTNNLWENRSGLDGKSEACGRTTWKDVWNEMKLIYTVFQGHIQCYCFCDRLNADEFTFNCTKRTRFSLPRFIRHEKSIFWCKENQERVQWFALQTIIFTPAWFSEINARAKSWLFLLPRLLCSC